MSADLVKHIKNNRGKVSLSVLLIVSFLGLAGAFTFTRNNTVNAAAITSASDTLGNSAPSASSSHTIVFTTPTGLVSGATMTVAFSTSTFTTGTLDYQDIDIMDDSVDVAIADVASGATWGATTTGQAAGWLFTNGTTVVAAGSIITIEIGTNATASSTGDENMGTPAKVAAAGVADIYTVTIGGGFGDSGDMLIAIVEGVAVSVTIDESLAFTIASETNTNCDTKFGTASSSITSTASSVPFGAQATPNVFIHGCQNLTVSTNASSGYVVTGQTDTSLIAGAILINNGVCDASCSETATDTWADATLNGFAYSATGTDAIIRSTLQYKTFACIGATTTSCLPGGGETAQNVMSNSASVSNTTSTVEYKLSFSGTQAAGTYSNTVTYIVTPTF